MTADHEQTPALSRRPALAWKVFGAWALTWCVFLCVGLAFMVFEGRFAGSPMPIEWSSLTTVERFVIGVKETVFWQVLFMCLATSFGGFGLFRYAEGKPATEFLAVFVVATTFWIAISAAAGCYLGAVKSIRVAPNYAYGGSMRKTLLEIIVMVGAQGPPLAAAGLALWRLRHPQQ